MQENIEMLRHSENQIRMELIALKVKFRKRLLELEFDCNTLVRDVWEHLGRSFGLEQGHFKVVGLGSNRIGECTLREVVGDKKQVKVVVLGTPLGEVEAMKKSAAIHEEKERELERIRLEKEQLQKERETKAREDEERRDKIRMEQRLERQRIEHEQRQRRIQEQKEELEYQRLNPPKFTLNDRIVLNMSLSSPFHICLSPHELEKIVSSNIPFPLVFRVDCESSIDYSQNPDGGFASVREFTEEPGNMGVSREWLDMYEIEEGDGVVLTFQELEKGEFVKIQPVQGEWNEISEIERTELLEFELLKYPFLFTGQSITIGYLGNQYTLNIVETKPQSIVSIADTNLPTDFVQSLHNPKHIPLLSIDEQVSFEITQNQSLDFGVSIEEESVTYRIECKVSEGDVDMYACFGSIPSVFAHSWKSQDEIGNSLLEIHHSDFHFQKGILNVSFIPFQSSISRGTILVTVIENTSHGNSLEPSPSLSSDTIQCSNCQRPIPSSSMAMHTVHCQRSIKSCPSCKQMIHKSVFDKHVARVHSKYLCVCGETFEQINSESHRENDCPKRIVRCRYCPIRMFEEFRGDHQVECCNRACQCRECGMSMQRKALERHLQREHDINGEIGFEYYA